MEDKIVESLAYVLPALVTGAVAYYMFSSFKKQEDNDSKFNALINKKKESLPIKLQAYERLLLFCERINPSKLLLRVNPIGENTDAYLHLLIGNIEQEFEHNLVQQLYISEDSWTAVVGSKLAIVNKLHQIANNTNNAEEFRKQILNEFSKTESPTETAIAIIKQDVKKLM